MLTRLKKEGVATWPLLDLAQTQTTNVEAFAPQQHGGAFLLLGGSCPVGCADWLFGQQHCTEGRRKRRPSAPADIFDAP